MSPIRNIEPRLRENIRVRLGHTVPAKIEGKTRPAALDTFKLTSPHQSLIERAAQQYGGKVEPFDGQRSADKWQVVTECSELPCAIPPINGFSQWYELWSGGGCQRRCDGVRELLGDTPCVCPEDLAERAELAAKVKPEGCRATTRITVVLYELGEMTGARLDTHSAYASSELLFLESLYAAARERRTMVPATLRIGERPAKDGKGMVKVPEVVVDIAAGMQTMGLAGRTAGQLAAATGQAALPPPDPSFGGPNQPIDVGGGLPPATKPESEKSRQRQVAEEIVESIFAVGMRDEEGATFISLVTSGRGTSPNILGPGEEAAARKFLTQIERRQLEIDFSVPCFINTNGERLHVHHNAREVWLSPDAPPPNWRVLAEGAGVTKATVLRKARETAAEMQLDAPSSIDDIVDEDLAAVVRTWLDTQARERAEKAGAPA